MSVSNGNLQKLLQAITVYSVSPPQLKVRLSPKFRTSQWVIRFHRTTVHALNPYWFTFEPPSLFDIEECSEVLCKHKTVPHSISVSQVGHRSAATLSHNILCTGQPYYFGGYLMPLDGHLLRDGASEVATSQHKVPRATGWFSYRSG